MIAWLAARARSTPDRVALEIGDAVVRFGELDESVRGLASALHARGLGRGDVLATLLGNGRAFVECFHAAARCGAILLPIHGRASVPETRFALGDAKARLLVHAGGELGVVARAAADACGVALFAAPDGAASSLAHGSARRAVGPEPDLDPGATMAVLYTSGTTGTPKGACLRSEGFLWNAAASALHLGALPDDRWLACLPLHHVGGLAILARSVLGGSTVIVHERFDALAVARALREGRVTGASLVPTMLSRVLDALPRGPLPASLRCVLVGGGPIPPTLLARAREAGLPIAATYGLTEATSQVATVLPGDSTPELWASPLPGLRVRIEDEDGLPLPPGKVGEICVQGPTVMSGYLGLPDETSRALRGGWLHTGDVGVLDEAGRLRVLDRRSDLVVSGGENVYPAEVEAVMLRHPGVLEVAVAGEPDADLGQRVLAAVVLREGTPPDPAALRAFCREHLSGFKVPRRIDFVAALPRTSSGKVLRRAIVGREG